MFNSIYKYIKGYKTIKIEGFNLENLLTECIKKNINIWDIEKIDSTSIKFKILRKDCIKFNKRIKNNKYRISTTIEKGIPKAMQKLIARKFMLIGLILFVIIVFIQSLYIKEIQIIGNEMVSTNLIKNSLENYGLKPNVLKKDINKKEIINNMMIEHENLAWLGIQIKGNKAIVEISEKISPPKHIPYDIPCDIVAIKNGYINKMIAKKGMAVVKEGDYVKKGDTLIKGEIINDNEEIKYVHSLGEVYAGIIYKVNSEKPIIETRKEETGNKTTIHRLKIGDKFFSINKKIKYKAYLKEIKETKEINITDRLSIQVITEEFKELKTKQIENNVDTVKRELEKDMDNEINKKMPENSIILNKDLKFSVEKNIIRVTAIYEVLEQIGANKRIYPLY